MAPSNQIRQHPPPAVKGGLELGWEEFGRKQAERIEMATLDLVHCPHCGTSLYHELLSDFRSPLLTCPQCKTGVAPKDLVTPSSL